jgi:hypothetical protein
MNFRNKNEGEHMADSKWQQVKIRIPEIKNWIIHYDANEKEIYTRLGISKNTWIKYKREYGILSAALFEARKYAATALLPELSNSMLKIALGYEEKAAEVVTLEIIDEKGNAKVSRKTIDRKYPPSESAAWKLMKHYSKDTKHPYVDNPAELILKKQRLELDKKALKIKEENDW